jgi:hypothetical protein
MKNGVAGSASWARKKSGGRIPQKPTGRRSMLQLDHQRAIHAPDSVLASAASLCTIDAAESASITLWLLTRAARLRGPIEAVVAAGEQARVLKTPRGSCPRVLQPAGAQASMN